MPSNLTVRSDERSKPVRIRDRQEQVLRYIQENAGRLVTRKMIASHLCTSQSNADHIIRRMEAKGLVRVGGIEAA